MSIILAKILGLYFVVIGLSFLFNTDRLKRVSQQVMKEESFLLIGAIISILFGAVIISIHNEWVLGWPVIITVLGWWGLIKGVLLLNPKSIKLFHFLLSRPNAFYRGVSLFWLVVGLFLLYKGWR